MGIVSASEVQAGYFIMQYHYMVNIQLIFECFHFLQKARYHLFYSSGKVTRKKAIINAVGIEVYKGKDPAIFIHAKIVCIQAFFKLSKYQGKPVKLIQIKQSIKKVMIGFEIISGGYLSHSGVFGI